MRSIGLFISCLMLAACSGGQAPVGPMAPPLQRSSGGQGVAQLACPQIAGEATCLGMLESKGTITPAVAGWAPSDLQKRYNLPSSTKGSGQIVAIVDAYDNPNVASDLATYRTEFGLGTANFTKYNQDGQTSNYPSGNFSWGVNKDQEVEMVSAACPKCTIYLIEANTSNGGDLQAAEVEAVKLGAHIVTNGYTCPGSVRCLDSSDFDTPGVVYLASSGTDGYNKAGAPAAFASVVSVGGTVLSKSDSTYRETVWADSEGGCATGVAKPSWQHDPDCTSRTISDIAAVAAGVATYDSYGYGGWAVGSGTDISAALNAGVFGLAGNASSQNAAEKFWRCLRRNATRNCTTSASGTTVRATANISARLEPNSSELTPGRPGGERPTA